jgi:hypothetical protein
VIKPRAPGQAAGAPSHAPRLLIRPNVTLYPHIHVRSKSTGCVLKLGDPHCARKRQGLRPVTSVASGIARSAAADAGTATKGTRFGPTPVHIAARAIEPLPGPARAPRASRHADAPIDPRSARGCERWPWPAVSGRRGLHACPVRPDEMVLAAVDVRKLLMLHTLVYGTPRCGSPR